MLYEGGSVEDLEPVHGAWAPQRDVIREASSSQFQAVLAAYLADVPGLQAQYDAARAMHRIPVTLPGGEALTLSPGGQNVLLKQIVENFCPYFTPGGLVFYAGDANSKWAGFDETGLAELGVFVDEHGKMPDLVVYLRDKHWLVLLEAASSHGPVDAQRHGKLGRLLVDPRHGDAGVNGPHQPPAGRTGRAAAAWLSFADGRGVGHSQDGRAPGRSTTAAAAAWE